MQSRCYEISEQLVSNPMYESLIRDKLKPDSDAEIIWKADEILSY